MTTEKTELTAQLEENVQVQAALRKQRGRRAGVLLALLAAGVAMRLLVDTEWNVVLVPILACLAVGCTWALLEALCFSARPVRYHKGFIRPFYYALLVPLWAIYSFALYALPTDASRWNEPLLDALISLLIALFLFVAPVVAAVLGILAISFGVKHVKTTPKTETALYREGPLVAASLLGALMFSICVFGVFVLL